MLAVLLKIKAVLLLHFARTVSALLLDGAASRALPVGFFFSCLVVEPGVQGVLEPLPTTLASMEAPLQILWRKKEEGENFEEKEEGMRGGRGKKERRAP